MKILAPPTNCRNIIIILLLSTFFTTSGCTTVRKNDVYSQPVVESKEFGEKEGKLRNSNYEELLEKGNYYLKKENFQLAGLHFTIAIKKEPDSPGGYIGLGQVLDREGKDDKSEKTFKKALKIEPHNRTSQIALGRLLRDRRRYQEALNYLEPANKEYPEDPVILTELAITYDKMGKTEKATPLYRKVVEIKQNSSAPYNNLGFNFLLQEKYQAAIYQLEKALNIQPENKVIRNNLASAYALAGKGEKAYQLLVKTVGKAGAYNDVGYFYMTRKMLHEAEKALKQALREHPVFYARARANLDRLEKIAAGQD